MEEFGPNIQHISIVDKIIADTLSRFPSTSVDKYKPSTSKAQCRANKLFTTGREEKNEDLFPLNLLNAKREQQKDLRKLNSKISAYILDWGSGYFK